MNHIGLPASYNIYYVGPRVIGKFRLNAKCSLAESRVSLVTFEWSACNIKSPLMERTACTRKARGQKSILLLSSFYVFFRCTARIRRFSRNATPHCLMSLLDRRCDLYLRLFRHFEADELDWIPFRLPSSTSVDALLGFGHSA